MTEFSIFGGNSPWGVVDMNDFFSHFINVSNKMIECQIITIFAGKATNSLLWLNETSEFLTRQKTALTHTRRSFTLENIEAQERWGAILDVHIPAQRCSAERMPTKPLCACNSTPDSFLFKQDETGGRQQRLAWDQKAVKHLCFVDSDGPHPACKIHEAAERCADATLSKGQRGIRWAKREKWE